MRPVRRARRSRRVVSATRHPPGEWSARHATLRERGGGCTASGADSHAKAMGCGSSKTVPAMPPLPYHYKAMLARCAAVAGGVFTWSGIAAFSGGNLHGYQSSRPKGVPSSWGQFWEVRDVDAKKVVLHFTWRYTPTWSWSLPKELRFMNPETGAVVAVLWKTNGIGCCSGCCPGANVFEIWTAEDAAGTGVPPSETPMCKQPMYPVRTPNHPSLGSYVCVS